MRNRIPILETCVECGDRARPNGALCRRCLRKRELAADLARPFPRLSRTQETDERARVEFGGRLLWPRDWDGTGCTCFELERGLCPKCSEDGERLWDLERDRQP